MRLPNKINVCQVTTLCFLAFLIYIIYSANTGLDNIFFQLVEALPAGDKIGHFILFGLLTYGVNLSARHHNIQAGTFRLPSGSLLIIAFMILEELSHYFLPLRTLDMADLTASLLGIVLFSIPSIRRANAPRYDSLQNQ